LPALPTEAANIWYSRGLPNFDDSDKLSVLDDGTGKAIPLYTAEQVRQAQLDAIAPYAERIRVLERANSSNSSSSCAQQQAQSIDSPEFRKLFFAAKHAPWNFDGSTPELAALIAYIDGRAAGAAPELYTCIGKGGTYELVGEADGAGYVRGGTVTVYRDATSGNLYYRTPVDFKTRMERIAAAPSPQPGKEGGNGQG
jgi:hypothetical protein